ncbi:MAG: flagellar hook-basal body complex protein [Actinobacteria bacterium]|nr:flagellar hook-basal body complex protein [Actinomycetota bacterium]
MIRSLFSGVSGLRNHQVRMDTLSNNISNVNTTGFKASRANFQDGLSQLLRSGGGSRNPMQVGTGINTASIGNDMNQGSLQNTGRTLDLAIQGVGFFKVSDGTNQYCTRDGAFFIDDEGYVVNSNGLNLLDEGGTEINLGTESVATLNISPLGEITGTDVSGADLAGAQIGIYTFPNPEGLTKASGSLYIANTDITGAETATTPGEGGAGTVESGYLEMSNSDLSNEFTPADLTQRGYQANARVITVSDTLLEELIQLKR